MSLKVKFAIQVNASPYQYQASDSAWHFVMSALSSGHEVYRVFFYNDGIYNAFRDARPPGDERHIVERWATLNAVHDIDLVVCVSSAQRRGLLDASVAEKVSGYQHALADGFRIAGLGLWMEGVIESDRHIVFGA